MAIDGTFIRRIAAILRIIIPGVFSPEAGFMFLVAAALIARSICDIWLIKNGTSIERLLMQFYKFVAAFFYKFPFFGFQCHYWA